MKQTAMKIRQGIFDSERVASRRWLRSSVEKYVLSEEMIGQGSVTKIDFERFYSEHC